LNGYKNRIIFTGRLNRNEVAKYGFPIKLGEYLSTGKPIIVTSVGMFIFFLKMEKMLTSQNRMM